VLFGGLVCALAGGLVDGCYPNPDDLRGTGTTVMVGDSLSCDDFASVLCAKSQACQPADFIYQVSTPDLCRSRISAYCQSTMLVASGAGWTMGTLASCAKGWASMTCTQWYDDPSYFPGPACKPPGKRANGMGCALDMQCSSYRCATGTSCGVCTAIAQSGQSCEVDIDCAAGLSCASGTKLCVPFGGVGASCDDDHRCLNALSCDNGTCAMAVGAGQRCTSYSDCDDSKGLACNGSTNQCVAITPSTTTCGYTFSDGSVRQCRDRGYCNNGTCMPSSGPGGHCDETNGPLCEFTLSCSSSGVCQAIGAPDCTAPATGTGGTSGSTGAAGQSGAAGMSGSDTLATAAVKFGQAICAESKLCTPALFTSSWPDATTCAQRIALNLTDVVALGDTGWTPATIDACASAYTTDPCANFINDVLPTACALPGKRATGMSCASLDQCQSLRCANFTNGCGTCLAKLGIGAACTEDDDCQGAICGANKTCVPAGSAGASCATDSGSCLHTLICRAGVCGTPGRGGSACTAHADCDYRNGFLCNGTTCVPATGGTTCSITTTAAMYCAAEGFCATGGTCLHVAAEGQACDDTNGPSCQFPAGCVNNVCALPSSNSCTMAASFSRSVGPVTGGPRPVRPVIDVMSSIARMLRGQSFPSPSKAHAP
jgi:hypothetical protein